MPRRHRPQSRRLVRQLLARIRSTSRSVVDEIAPIWKIAAISRRVGCDQVAERLRRDDVARARAWRDCAICRRAPADRPPRSSRSPRASSAATRFEPMKPAPPVTTIMLARSMMLRFQNGVRRTRRPLYRRALAPCASRPASLDSAARRPSGDFHRAITVDRLRLPRPHATQNCRRVAIPARAQWRP